MATNMALLAVTVVLVILIAHTCGYATCSQFPFQDYTLSNDERIEDFISRLTIQEKADQLVSMSPPIPRLNWTGFNWRSECCHGWGFTGSDYKGSGWNGTATVFPHVIGLAASWDEELVEAIGNAAGTEGRAAYNSAKQQGIHGHMMTGLHCFGPTTNVNHDPRWGRIKRTWGEDPFLTGTLNSAHIKGLQKGDTRYMKMAADVNMFAVHSGPDSIRTHFDISVSDRELYDFYLPAFEQTVKEGGVSSVMVAYSAFQGIPDNCNPRLLTEVLLNEWNFSMISFSDNGGVRGIVVTQKYASTYMNASALSINAGLHQDMASGGPGHSNTSSWVYGGCIWNSGMPQAVQAGLVKEELLDNALRRVLGVRFKLGAEDPDWLVPFSDIGLDAIGCEAHTQLALEAARKSIVLLRNNGTLPLSQSKPCRILLVGPHANSTSVYFGGTYSAFPTVPTDSILQLMTSASKWPADHPLYQTIKSLEVEYSEGCSDVTCPDTSRFAAALNAANNSDFIIYVGGIDGDKIEHEGGDRGTEESNWKKSKYPCEGQDTDPISMPGCQEHLISSLALTGKPLIVVHMNGGPVSCINCTYQPSAVLDTFYGGQAGSQAIVETLFGVNNPAGRMPYSVVPFADTLWNFTDYEIAKPNDDGRTYRYISASSYVLHHFGDGLSYTTFNYSELQFNKTIQPCDEFHFNVTVTNAGHYLGDEVVQVYYYSSPETTSVRLPRRSLKAFRRINLDVGDSTTLSFCLTPYALSMVDNEGHRQLYPGDYNFSVGGRQIRGALSFADVIEGAFTISHAELSASQLSDSVPLSTCKETRLRC